MAAGAKAMRGDGPFVFTQARGGFNVEVVVDHILHAQQHALAMHAAPF
jgi:hypothetical protein